MRLFIGKNLNFGLMLGSGIFTVPLLMMRSVQEVFRQELIVNLDHPPYLSDLAT